MNFEQLLEELVRRLNENVQRAFGKKLKPQDPIAAAAAEALLSIRRAEAEAAGQPVPLGLEVEADTLPVFTIDDAIDLLYQVQGRVEANVPDILTPIPLTQADQALIFPERAERALPVREQITGLILDWLLNSDALPLDQPQVFMRDGEAVRTEGATALEQAVLEAVRDQNVWILANPTAPTDQWVYGAVMRAMVAKDPTFDLETYNRFRRGTPSSAEEANQFLNLDDSIDTALPEIKREAIKGIEIGSTGRPKPQVLAQVVGGFYDRPPEENPAPYAGSTDQQVTTERRDEALLRHFATGGDVKKGVTEFFNQQGISVDSSLADSPEEAAARTAVFNRLVELVKLRRAEMANTSATDDQIAAMILSGLRDEAPRFDEAAQAEQDRVATEKETEKTRKADEHDRERVGSQSATRDILFELGTSADDITTEAFAAIRREIVQSGREAVKAQLTPDLLDAMRQAKALADVETPEGANQAVDQFLFNQGSSASRITPEALGFLEQVTRSGGAAALEPLAGDLEALERQLTNREFLKNNDGIRATLEQLGIGGDPFEPDFEEFVQDELIPKLTPFVQRDLGRGDLNFDPLRSTRSAILGLRPDLRPRTEIADPTELTAGGALGGGQFGLSEVELLRQQVEQPSPEQQALVRAQAQQALPLTPGELAQRVTPGELAQRVTPGETPFQQSGQLLPPQLAGILSQRGALTGPFAGARVGVTAPTFRAPNELNLREFARSAAQDDPEFQQFLESRLAQLTPEFSREADRQARVLRQAQQARFEANTTLSEQEKVNLASVSRTPIVDFSTLARERLPSLQREFDLSPLALRRRQDEAERGRREEEAETERIRQRALRRPRSETVRAR